MGYFMIFDQPDDGFDQMKCMKKNRIQTAIAVDSLWDYPLAPWRGNKMQTCSPYRGLGGNPEDQQRQAFLLIGWFTIELGYCLYDMISKQGGMWTKFVARWGIQISGGSFSWEPSRSWALLPCRRTGWSNAWATNQNRLTSQPQYHLHALHIKWRCSIKWHCLPRIW